MITAWNFWETTCLFSHVVLIVRTCPDNLYSLTDDLSWMIPLDEGWRNFTVCKTDSTNRWEVEDTKFPLNRHLWGNRFTKSCIERLQVLCTERKMKKHLLPFIYFQDVVAAIKKKEYNFLDQRKMDFDQDYDEFCKQTNELHVGCIVKPLGGGGIFPQGRGRGRGLAAISACILWFKWLTGGSVP